MEGAVVLSQPPLTSSTSVSSLAQHSVQLFPAAEAPKLMGDCRGLGKGAGTESGVHPLLPQSLTDLAIGGGGPQSHSCTIPASRAAL